MENLIDSVLMSTEWQRLQQFILDHKGDGLQNFPDIERKLDGIAQQVGWAYDVLNGTRCDSKSSIARKIRKALGYTIP